MNENENNSKNPEEKQEIVSTNEDIEYDDKEKKIVEYYIALNKYFDKKRVYQKKKVKKCISCSNTNGTIFEYKDGMYTAKCGNISSPCVLDVSIRRGRYKSLNETLQEEIKKYNESENPEI